MGRELETTDKEITKATLCMVNPYEAFTLIKEEQERIEQRGLDMIDMALACLSEGR